MAAPDLAGAPGTDPFPELGAEQAWLEHARACRLAMIERLRPLLTSSSAADEHTDDYVRSTASRQLADLADPSAADFFGRIDSTEGERLHIGRRHIEERGGDPVVIDWRAGAAAAFYRATVADPMDLVLRRRFTLGGGQLVSYNDDHLDDPEAGIGGIPDPVLAELAAARSGAMRDIVATIAGEQDRIIRSPLDGCVIVQGGPGTGKTAVGLHRAAYLLFEHRRVLSSSGVLVVGPNKVFLDYIGHVLPSLGERSVTHKTWTELAVPAVETTADDNEAGAHVKGDLRMATLIERAITSAIVAPKDTISIGVGAVYLTITPEDWQSWIDRSLPGRAPLDRRRSGFRRLVIGELVRRQRRREEAVQGSKELKAAIDKVWPSMKAIDVVGRLLTNAEHLAGLAEGLLTTDEQAAIRRRAKAAWTVHDLPLLDEAHALLRGVPVTYGHVVVDEAQDRSTMALRMIGRRSPAGSFTVLGDLAQSTAMAGQTDWDDVVLALDAVERHRVEHLTVGYRVPGPILDVANRLLPLAGVTTPPSRSVRELGAAPLLRDAPTADVAGLTAATVAEVIALKQQHPLTGVIAPAPLVDAIGLELHAHGLRPSIRVDGLAADEVPVLTAEAAKGLELDAVVIADPARILGTDQRGARLLYVALTRAVQLVSLIGPAPLVLLADRVDNMPGHPSGGS